MTYTALESKDDIQQAIEDLESAVKAEGEHISDFAGGLFWVPRYGFWAVFGGTDTYWNVFGLRRGEHNKNKIVQINPPVKGKNKNRQGVVAKDANGRRWLLHQGRLHPSKLRVTEEMFDEVSNRARVAVKFSTGADVWYHKVTNIDAPRSTTLKDLASFITECERVRLYYLHDKEFSDGETKVLEAEQSSSPEKTGTYTIPPQDEKIIDKKHAAIWKALVKHLDDKGIKHSNERVGRWGPDLRTINPKNRILFEIKSAGGASSIQQGVGQLLMYEDLLEKSYRKAIVLPLEPPSKILQAMGSLGVKLVTFEKSGRTFKFSNALSELLTK
ncbi:MAG: hypothetical protein K2P94_03650 [Rhodospirillaceae bacterium]|nr:hypothetical protein [Rhodospirillaceae bacterium]